MDSKGWSWMFPPEPHQEPWHGCGCVLLPLVPWPGCTPPQGLGGSGSGRRLPQDAPHVPQRAQGPHRAGSRANLYGLWCYAAVGGRRSRGSTAPTPLIPRGSCPFPTAPGHLRHPLSCHLQRPATGPPRRQLWSAWQHLQGKETTGLAWGTTPPGGTRGAQEWGERRQWGWQRAGRLGQALT